MRAERAATRACVGSESCVEPTLIQSLTSDQQFIIFTKPCLCVPERPATGVASPSRGAAQTADVETDRPRVSADVRSEGSQPNIEEADASDNESVEQIQASD